MSKVSSKPNVNTNKSNSRNYRQVNSLNNDAPILNNDIT